MHHKYMVTESLQASSESQTFVTLGKTFHKTVVFFSVFWKDNQLHNKILQLKTQYIHIKFADSISVHVKLDSICAFKKVFSWAASHHICQMFCKRCLGNSFSICLQDCQQSSTVLCQRRPLTAAHFYDSPPMVIGAILLLWFSHIYIYRLLGQQHLIFYQYFI